MVIIVQACCTTFGAVVVSVECLRVFSIIVVIISVVKRLGHVSRGGWRKVALLTARRTVTSSHGRERGMGGSWSAGVVDVVDVVEKEGRKREEKRKGR